jgi:hypothetical protein
MAQGEAVFIKNQYGLETTRGTGVAATRNFAGTVVLPADRKPGRPVEKTGSRIQSRRAVIKQILVDGIQMKMDAAYFQALLMIFGIGLKGGVTGSAVTGGGNDYLSDFTPSWTAANSPATISLETGDNVQGFEIDYVMAKSIKISGKIGADEFIKVEVECFGKETTPTTFTASILSENGEYMIANLTKLWIDNNWALLGTTQKTDLLREFSIEILTGNHPKFFAAGVKTMNGFGEGTPEMAITLTMEGNTDADVLFDGYQAGTEYALRLMMEGGPTGTGFTNHSLTIDAFGTFDEVVPMASEDNGNNISTGVFIAMGDRGQVAQVETATAVGTITQAGDATVIVTAAGMTGSPKTISVAVLLNDTAAVWAGKVRTALAADSAVTALYEVGGAAAVIKLTRKVPVANDTSLNISLDNGTCTGITTAASSADTTAGAVSSAAEHKFAVKVVTDRATMA